jgi:hypothetical protein
VISQVTEDFWKSFSKLPEPIKAQARKSYRLWKANPSHPGLHFKRIHGHEALYSVRISKGWRVLGLLDNDVMTWFWVGTHADYEKLIKR